MSTFEINDEDITSLNGKVVVLTGCSSGIGLATVELLLQLGAIIIAGDRNPTPTDHPQLTFQKTEVTVWKDLVALFKLAKDKHGRIDHVFANAGITGRANYLDETFDADGELEEPSNVTYDVDLRACINTSYLGLYHMRHQEPAGGSIVCTASAAAFQRFRVTDYTSAKHGVLGWVRGIVPNIETQGLPIRVNAISPSWTKTGLVPDEAIPLLDCEWQGPDVVARSVAVLMADSKRQGQLIYSWAGKFMEIEEASLLPNVKPLVGQQDEDAAIAKLHKLASQVGYS